MVSSINHDTHLSSGCGGNTAALLHTAEIHTQGSIQVDMHENVFNWGSLKALVAADG